jgi:hypothetical protein
MRNEWVMREEHFLEGNKAHHNINLSSLPAKFQGGASK